MRKHYSFRITRSTRSINDSCERFGLHRCLYLLNLIQIASLANFEKRSEWLAAIYCIKTEDFLYRRHIALDVIDFSAKVFIGNKYILDLRIVEDELVFR